MITRDEIIQAAKTFLNLPYKHQHSMESVGVDCVGLIIATARKIGYADYRPPPYRISPDPALFTKLLTDNFVQIEDYKQAKPGDIIGMDHCEGLQHIGILLPDNQLIHSCREFRKVVLHDIDAFWQERIDRAKIAFTWRGLIE